MKRAIPVILVAAFSVVALTETVRAAPAAPTLTSPEDGATLETLGPTLTWSNPGGATQYHIQVIPSGNDGPGIDLQLGAIGDSYTVPPPPRWYGLLPDMTYTWQVRVSDAPTTVPDTDASWGPWSERKFRTPKAVSDTIAPATPTTGEVVLTKNPVLQWVNSNREIFYYEIQLSKDRTFNTDRPTATAPVYWELRHGGRSSPLNSYAIQDQFPLDDNTTYYWRVRPRVQGDGQPVAWSATSSFQVNTRAGAPLVRIERIAYGLAAPDQASCNIANPTTTFASSPTLTGVHIAVKYSGAGSIVRNWFVNNQPFLVFTDAIESNQSCLFGSYGTPGGGPDAGVPLAPANYRLEVWHAGERQGIAEFTIEPPAEFAIGPVTIGTKLEDSRTCRVSGVGTTFPRTTKTIWPRFNFVGSGSFSANIYYRGTRIARTATVDLPPNLTFGCIDDLPYTPPDGFGAGPYRFDVVADDRIAQTVTFTIN